MKTFLGIVLSILCLQAVSQEWPLKKAVEEAFANQKNIITTPLLAGTGLQQMDNGPALLVDLDKSAVEAITQKKPSLLQVAIPLPNGTTSTAQLIKYTLGNVQVTTNNLTPESEINLPTTYRGILQEEDRKHVVLLGLNGDYSSLNIILPEQNLRLQPVNNAISEYALVNEKATAFNLNCGNSDDGPLQKQIAYENPSPELFDASEKCVMVFVECFDSLYQWQNNSLQQTVNYVYDLFAHVSTGYLNEQINILIDKINVWTTADPFNSANRSVALRSLADYHKDNFYGNIGVGLDFGISDTGRGGLADNIGVSKAVFPNLCPAYTNSSSAFCYNDLNYTVNTKNFPFGPVSNANQVYLVMHEIGHLLGSQHTKWCGWKLSSNPDVFGAIDSCGAIEGNCAKGPPTGPGGATIMSYCVTDTVTNFVNYLNGFGPLPGAAIRNFVSAQTCIPTCIECIGRMPFSLPTPKFPYRESLSVTPDPLSRFHRSAPFILTGQLSPPSLNR